MPHVNWLAVLAAAAASFGLGGTWYSGLFAKRWQAAAGVSDDQVRGGNKPLMFAGAFVLALIQAAVFAMFLGPNVTLAFGVGAGFAAGLCWVATAIALTYIFERRSLALALINGGYATLQFTLIGAILGAWH
jgi:MFS family permease